MGQQLLNLQVAAPAALLVVGDLEDHAFRGIEQLIGAASFGIEGTVSDFRAGMDELP